MAFSNWAKCWKTPLPPNSTLSPFFASYFLVGKILTTLADLNAFLKAVIASYINLRENGRKIKTFCHPTPDPHTLKNSGMGNWRVLAFVRLMLHFEEKGKLLFHLFGPRQIDGKLRTPLAPKEKKNNRKKKEKKHRKIARLRLGAPLLQPWLRGMILSKIVAYNIITSRRRSGACSRKSGFERVRFEWER